MRTWRIGGKPGVKLPDLDRDLLDEASIADALQHARKLQGLTPYTMAEVKPRVSACVIFTVVAAYDRLRECKGARKYKELHAIMLAQREENAEHLRELRRLWLIESRYKALKAQCEQGELFAAASSSG